MMKYIDTLADYSQHTNIPLPKHEDFDARTFAQNMPTVKRIVEPFKHEFYAVGLLLDGTSHNWNGIKDFKANIVFNSPYQLISWDIDNDWEGQYVIFTQDFISKCHFYNNLLIDFPFLKLDQTFYLNVPSDKIDFLSKKFEQIIEEYNSEHSDKFAFIENYLHLILLSIKRFTTDTQTQFEGTEQNRQTDITLLSRYQSLIDKCFNQTDIRADYFATSYYAEQLNIHPNYLNAIVKRITGSTAKQVVQDKIVVTAKSLLSQTDNSIKEIAYRLGFSEATHFGSFFKKNTDLTPAQFREVSRL